MEWTSKQAFDFFEVATPNYGKFKDDDMGVELEIEYEGVQELKPVNTFFRGLGWRTDGDNSLRGVAAEHISPPQSLEKTYVDALAFDKFLAEAPQGVRINNSHRCSTHVHLNFDNTGVTDIIKFTALYYIFEPMLAYIAGPDRVSNCFCVSTRTVPLTISENILSKKPFYRHIDEQEYAKYSSLNFCRLHDLGTIEVRLMRGYEKAIKLKNWLTVLRDIRMYSVSRFKSLEDIEQKYLDIPYEDFISYVFPEGAEAIFAAKIPNLKSLVAEGYRMAFPIIQTKDMLDKAVTALEKAKRQEQEEEQNKMKALDKLRKKAIKPLDEDWLAELFGDNP